MNNKTQPGLFGLKTSPSVLALALVAITTPLLSMTVQGAGLQLMPGSPNFGTAGAGHAAIGLGAGSAWANPATMVLVEGQQIGLGIIAAETDVQFDADDPDVDSGGNAGGEIFIPSFAYVNSVSDNLSLGFSFVVPYGNSLDYDEEWGGDNVATSVHLQTLQAMPSLAYRINDQFSLGFGITANQTSVEQELTMSMGPVKMDVALEAESIDYGWTLGGLYELNADHRFGFVYRSQVDSDLTGDGSISGTTYDTELNWENPASIVISGVHKIDDKVTLMWDLGRTFYSAFEETQVQVDMGEGLDLTLHRNWQDANRYAVGSHYQLNDKVILQAGYSYEESTVETEDRSVDMPLDDIQRFTLGAMYQMNNAINLGLGLEYASLGEANTQANPDSGAFEGPQGSYDSSAVAGSFSINYAF